MAPPKPNGFSCFMFEYKEQQRKSGREISAAQATSECNPLWQAMDNTTRAAYKAKAKNMKQGQLVKLASDGTVLTDFEKREQERAAQDKRDQTEIALKIANTPRNHLPDMKFYFIDASLFCKTLRDVYVPAEISLLEFNIRKGTTSILHLLINPGSVPEGYLSDALTSTRDIHCIPIPPYDDTVTTVVNMQPVHEAYQLIMDWINERRGTNEIPIFCTWDNHITTVRGVLNTLSRYDGIDNKIRVSSAAVLLFHLKNAAEEDSVNRWPALDAARESLSRDPYYHIESIACQFHKSDEERLNKITHCTLSNVQRLVYYLTDHCCRPMNIKMLPDVHGPADYLHCSVNDGPKESDEDDEKDDVDGWNVVASRPNVIRSNTGGRGRRGGRN